MGSDYGKYIYIYTRKQNKIGGFNKSKNHKAVNFTCRKHKISQLKITQQTAAGLDEFEI